MQFWPSQEGNPIRPVWNFLVSTNEVIILIQRPYYPPKESGLAQNNVFVCLFMTSLFLPVSRCLSLSAPLRSSFLLGRWDAGRSMNHKEMKSLNFTLLLLFFNRFGGSSETKGDFLWLGGQWETWAWYYWTSFSSPSFSFPKAMGQLPLSSELCFLSIELPI